jgi:putative endonuclease
MSEKQAYVYILASKKKGTLYTGVTNNLLRRVLEHKAKTVKGFTAKYNIDKLVWFVSGDSISAAIELEKKIKNRGRQWKIDLIERNNPDWNDLSVEWMDSATAPGGLAQNDEVSTRAATNKQRGE